MLPRILHQGFGGEWWVRRIRSDGTVADLGPFRTEAQAERARGELAVAERHPTTNHELDKEIAEWAATVSERAARARSIRRTTKRSGVRAGGKRDI